MKNSLFFLLSGEHDTLPPAEVLAILESESFTYHDVKSSQKLLTLDASHDCLPLVSKRAGMCETSGQLIFRCKDQQDEIIKRASETDFSQYLESGMNFSVRVLRVFGSSRHLHKLQLQSDLGQTISSLSKSKADLKHPEKEFIGIISEGLFFFGLIASKRQDNKIDQRNPKLRPSSHPSTLKPRLARCFVNLARARKGEIMLDPFCGVGGILIEGGTMGCRVAGSDLDPRMIHKAIRNLKHYNIYPETLMIADGRNLPYFTVSSIATDPPYGRGASTMGSELRVLLREFLSEAKSTLTRDGFLCLASPAEMKIKSLGLEASLKVIESHIIRVHRSLDREVVVFSRKKLSREDRVPWNLYS